MQKDTDDTTFVEVIAAHKDKALTVTVYNSKTETLRNVDLKPSLDWGDGQKGLLGITIRYDSFEDALDSIEHVTTVHAGSPGEQAGLKAGSDYLLGSTSMTAEMMRDLGH